MAMRNPAQEFAGGLAGAMEGGVEPRADAGALLPAPRSFTQLLGILGEELQASGWEGVLLALEPDSIALRPLGGGQWGAEQVIAVGGYVPLVRGASACPGAPRPGQGKVTLRAVLQALGAELDRLGLRQALVGYVPPYAWIQGTGTAAGLWETLGGEALCARARQRAPGQPWATAAGA